jgi:hypothetical protein
LVELRDQACPDKKPSVLAPTASKSSSANENGTSTLCFRSKGLLGDCRRDRERRSRAASIKERQRRRVSWVGSSQDPKSRASAYERTTPERGRSVAVLAEAEAFDLAFDL